MASLATTVLRAWEHVDPVPRLQRPAVLLAALSGISVPEAMRLGVARRDTALLSWHAALFGTKWPAFAECPRCQAMVEYEMPVAPEAYATPSEVIEIQAGEEKLAVRWPDSQDLLDASSCADRVAGRSLLVSRICSRKLSEADLPTVLEALSQAHRACWTVTLTCCACPHSWQVVFHPGEFLWREIRAMARRILHEVDALARVYHWSESEILELSETRRNSYLEMVHER